jgi:DNA-binding NtrC family response regulator
MASSQPGSAAVSSSALAATGGESIFEQRLKRRRWSRLPGVSPVMQQLERAIERVAQFECPVLITGETGCGKEEVARAIHAAGSRRARPFVSINCGSLVAGIAESQLFGHEKGSFTGAVGPTAGGFRAADGGVIFLDEIGELPLDLQPKLLQVLQRHEVVPLGATAAIPVDVQVLAATNRELEAEVAQRRFREDLFYRLNTVHLVVPPLRTRQADIPRLIEHFSEHYATLYGREPWRPDDPTLERLLACPWPGNVRQLAQTIQRVYVFGQAEVFGSVEVFGQAEVSGSVAVVTPATAPDARADAGASVAGGPHLPAEIYNLMAVRNDAVRRALAATGGHRGKAAKLLGVSPNTMTKLVAQACPERSAPRRPRRPKPR